MKLSEMKRLPKKAGLATLIFDREVGWPERKDNRIFLPYAPEAKFFPLKKGRQFLFWHKEHYSHSGGGWFGGTDERPFLVELDWQPFLAFEGKKREEEREKNFYAELKPWIIEEAEKKYNIRAKRQGDIWAAPIPYSWDDISSFMFDLTEYRLTERRHRPSSVKSKALFETRHQLTGLFSRFGVKGPWELEPSIIFVLAAESKIEALDHSPMELKGIHVLARTPYIIDPDD